MEQTVATSPPRNSSANILRNFGNAIVAQIMSGLRAVIQKITGSSGDLSKSFGTDITNSLDIDKVALRLKIEDRARADGRSDLPPSDNESLLGTQQEIVVYFRELQRKAHYQVAEFTRKLCEHGEKIDLPGTRSHIGDIPSRYDSRIRRLIAESQYELNMLAERGVQQQQHLEQSETTSNKEQLEDKSATGITRFFYLALLIGAGAFAMEKFALPVIEGAVPSDGIVEPAVGAPLLDFAAMFPPVWTIVSVVAVVMVSFLMARVLAYFADQAARERRAMRWLSGATGMFLVAIVAFIAANYAAATVIAPSVSIVAIVTAALTDWTNLFTNLSAWSGIVIFLSAGTLAFLVGFSRDDDVASQGDRRSAIDQTHRQYGNLTKRLRRQINSIIDSADAEVSALVKQVKKSSSKYSGLLEVAKRIPANLSDYDIALEDGCNILLDRYRATNQKARRSDVPTSFDEHICFRAEREPDFAVFRDEERRLEEIRQGITGLEDEAVTVRQSLRDLNSRAIGALDEVTETS